MDGSTLFLKDAKYSAYSGGLRRSSSSRMWKHRPCWASLSKSAQQNSNKLQFTGEIGDKITAAECEGGQYEKIFREAASSDDARLPRLFLCSSGAPLGPLPCDHIFPYTNLFALFTAFYNGITTPTPPRLSQTIMQTDAQDTGTRDARSMLCSGGGGRLNNSHMQPYRIGQL